jgi:hypothetical protein
MGGNRWGQWIGQPRKHLDEEGERIPIMQVTYFSPQVSFESMYTYIKVSSKAVLHHVVTHIIYKYATLHLSLFLQCHIAFSVVQNIHLLSFIILIIFI